MMPEGTMQRTSELTCIACGGWGKLGESSSGLWPRVALLPLATIDLEADLTFESIYIHPACVVEYLNANPALAITSRLDAMDWPRPLGGGIDEGLGYPGVESLGMPEMRSSRLSDSIADRSTSDRSIADGSIVDRESPSYRSAMNDAGRKA